MVGKCQGCLKKKKTTSKNIKNNLKLNLRQDTYEWQKMTEKKNSTMANNILRDDKFDLIDEKWWYIWFDRFDHGI